MCLKVSKPPDTITSTKLYTKLNMSRQHPNAIVFLLIEYNVAVALLYVCILNNQLMSEFWLNNNYCFVTVSLI